MMTNPESLAEIETMAYAALGCVRTARRSMELGHIDAAHVALTRLSHHGSDIAQFADTAITHLPETSGTPDVEEALVIEEALSIMRNPLERIVAAAENMLQRNSAPLHLEAPTFSPAEASHLRRCHSSANHNAPITQEA